MPKQHLDKNELFETCALREVREETGLEDISIVRFIGVTGHEYYDGLFNEDAIKEIHWYENKRQLFQLNHITSTP